MPPANDGHTIALISGALISGALISGALVSGDDRHARAGEGIPA
jgi:hypothetical protein